MFNISGGPDFARVDSLPEALERVRRGELEKLLLMPVEFGGKDTPQNVVYVPVGFAAAKSGIDLNIIAPLIQQGKVSQYSATPEYQGRSFVPIAIKIAASSPDDFSTVINIWGEALSTDEGRGGAR